MWLWLAGFDDSRDSSSYSFRIYNQRTLKAAGDDEFQRSRDRIVFQHCSLPHGDPWFNDLLHKHGVLVDSARAEHSSGVQVGCLLKVSCGIRHTSTSSWPTTEELFLHTFLKRAPDAYSYQIDQVWEIAGGARTILWHRRTGGQICQVSPLIGWALPFDLGNDFALHRRGSSLDLQVADIVGLMSCLFHCCMCRRR